MLTATGIQGDVNDLKNVNAHFERVAKFQVAYKCMLDF